MTGRALLCGRAGEHLAKLLGYLGSDHAGERAAAGLKAHEFIRQLGLTWHDVIHVPPEWQAMAAFCRDRADELSNREYDFVANISRARRMPTDRQLDWLESIYERLREEMAS